MDLLEHSLQTATRAYWAGGALHWLYSLLSNHVTPYVTRCAAEDVEFVVAALVHDIGELLVPISHGTSTLLLLSMPSALLLWCKLW